MELLHISLPLIQSQSGIIYSLLLNLLPWLLLSHYLKKKSFKAHARGIQYPLSPHWDNSLSYWALPLLYRWCRIMTFFPPRILDLSLVANSSFFSWPDLSHFFLYFWLFCDPKLNPILHCYFESLNIYVSLPINPHSTNT